jgi:hypothetical protein
MRRCDLDHAGFDAEPLYLRNLPWLLGSPGV